MRIFAERAGVADIGSHPHCISGLTGCFDKYIGSLANSKCDHVGVIRLDGYKVVGNDSHDVVINGKSLDCFSSSIDQPQSVGVSASELELGDPSVGRARDTDRSKGAVESHFPIDEIAVGEWWRIETRSHNVFDDVKVVSVGPVVLHQGQRCWGIEG